MKKLSFLITFLSFVSIGIYGQKVPFQGYYEEDNIPVTGARDISFQIPAYGWVESHSAVSMDKGLYTLVLGSITALPDSLFYTTDVEEITINIGGDTLAAFQLYKPVSGKYSTQNGGSVQVNNDAGKLRADLNFFTQNDAGSLVLYGANDSTKAILGTSNGGYNGSLFLYDSLRNAHVALEGRNTGGRLQLSSRESGLLNSAVLTGASPNTSYMNLYGANIARDGVGLMIANYITGNQIDFGPAMSGNYQRSGTDWSDNEGKLLAAIGNSRDESGPDPTGTSGYLSLWGTNSFNAQLTGKRWQNNDLPTLELFGSNDDGGTFWLSNVSLEVAPGSGTDNFGNLVLKTTDNGGVSRDGVIMSSNMNATGGGGIEMFDNATQRTVYIEGSTGFMELTSGFHAGDFFDNSILIQNGNFQMYGGGTGGAVDDGQVTSEFSNFGLNGRLYLKGFSDSGTNQDRVVVEAVDDLAGNTYGRASFFDGAGTATITIEAINGTITTTGPITAEGVQLTSDRRFKTNIQPLKSSLSLTNQLRGVSYIWKDQNKSQKRQIGVIAQEVEEIFPEFVHTNSEGFKSVNYAQMTAVLIEAIKELNAKLENLEEQNDNLKASLEETKELKSRLDRIEKLLMLENESQNN